MSKGDSIFAFSTPEGRSAIAVMRVSGPASRSLFHDLSGQRQIEVGKPVLAPLIDPAGKKRIDQPLYLLFAAPRSFTGEDLLEIHIHGSPALRRRLLQILSRKEGLRFAEPGEFCRRAFHNGKLNLSELEGISALISANTPAELNLALPSFFGELERIYESWNDRLMEISALVEAEIDFSDQDLPDGLADKIYHKRNVLRSEIEVFYKNSRRARGLSEGLRVVLAGPPNAGKSSLFNALLDRQAAIVTDIPGTTRDALEARLEIGGYPIRLFDTAGLHGQSLDALELLGMEKSEEAIAKADLVLHCHDLQRQVLPLQNLRVPAKKLWRLGLKHDLVPASEPEGFKALLSSVTGKGLEGLVLALEGFAKERFDPVQHHPVELYEEQFWRMEKLCDRLAELSPDSPPEINAEHLRTAVHLIEQILGRGDVEDLLGRIFSNFCVGK